MAFPIGRDPMTGAERSARYRKEHPSYSKRDNEKRFPRYIKNKYGIDIKIYNEMARDQKGLCAICGKKNSRGYRLVVDHNHKSKKIRGLLCQSCNLMIGSAHESPFILQQASTYIRIHNDGEQSNG